MEIKIFNLFAVSELYELELLLAKCNLENNFVSGWIICENDYSLRGTYKGEHSFRKAIWSDKRFEPFLDKIHIIEMSFKYECKEGIDDFTVIYKQRDIEQYAVQQLANDEDIIIISDLDEMINFTNPEAIKIITKPVVENNLVCPIANWFIWDFDNLLGYSLETIRILTIKKLKEIQLNPQLKLYHNLQMIRHLKPDIILKPEIPIAYHYHNCYPKIDIWRKFNTYGHTGFTEEYLDKMLKYNCSWGREIGSELTETNFLKGTVELTVQNSPLYIRENLERLRTNNINPDYENLRKIDFY